MKQRTIYERMEQQWKTRNLIIILLLTTATASSNRNHYEFTTINIGSTGSNPAIDYTSLRNTTTSIHQDSTTYLPTVQTSVKTDEILDSSETNVLSRYAQPSYSHNEDIDEDDEEPEEVSSDHVIPYSVHEEARDVPTRPKYVAPGNWATPPPEKNIPLDFVPVKLHAQVRGTHTVKRLPRREAIESAETDEEKLNAHRLREVVTNSKVNTIYTEEGYEDSAYDHAGHVRDADFHEGYARKLHDRRKKGRSSSSGKARTGEHSNLVPDEFKEYDEDYQDHVKENRKHEDDEDNLIEYGRNIWEGSEVDPKLVAETGIRKLEEDTKKEAEESERNSESYQNAQESKLRNDIDSSESEEDEDDFKDKENKTKKKKVDTSAKDGKKPRRSDQRKKKLYDRNYEATVGQPGKIKTSLTDIKVSATPQDFVTNPSVSQVYSIDGTTRHFVAPIDEPTTINYSQLFWDYFKAKKSPSSTETSVSNSTTMNPQPEERTPIAVATIDGHGPYLLLTKEETTRTPSTFFDSFYPKLSSDSVKFGSTLNQNRHLLGHIDDVDYFTNVPATTTTVATSPNKKPDLFQSSSLSPENAEHSSSTSLLDGVTSTSPPTVMILNITKEALSELDDYIENPFLGPILDKSNIAFLKNKMKYKVLVRPEPKKSAKPVGDQSSRQHASSPLVSHQEEEHKRIRDELNAKYNKVMNYIKSKQTPRSPPEKKKVTHSDISPMRPPISQRIAYSIFPTNRSTTADRPSVSIENESPWKAAKKSLLQDQHRSQAIKSKPYHFDPFVYVQPVYHKNVPPPATKLLPPPPPPSIANTYGNYHNNRQNGYHFSQVSGKSQQQPQQQRDNAFKYLPLVPEATWKTRSRRKRSDGFHDAVSDVKAAANNGMTNGSETKEQRDEDTTRLAFPVRSRNSESGASAALERGNSTVVNNKSENARKPTNDSSTLVDEELLLRSQRNVRSRKGHEELLNESPKISGTVIDKEIAARFNDDDKKDDETSAEIEEEKKVEVEVPSFDYVDELADEEVPEPSTTTEVTVDPKKYPFYNNEDVPSASALKYVVDPKTIPRKTSSRMAFYDSRNAYKQCDEVEPNLDEVLPEKEEPDPEREPPENLPRLRGLGDKLDCFKAKYFDENPLDNPLFAEKYVGDPTPPSELNPTKFASKILMLPEASDDYVVHQVSKKPERNGRQLKNRNRPYETQESIRVNYKHDPRTGRGRNAYLHTVRGSRPPLRRLKNQRSRSKSPSGAATQSPKLYQTESYQNQVYEDVMGNIRNMANSYQVHEMTTSLPSPTQILATAGSENTLKIADVVPREKEKTTLSPDDTDVSTIKYESTKSPEIKGLVPPPKYLIPQQTGYRKHRPSGKSRILMRSSNIPRIVAHRHTIRINKRSTINDTAEDSFKNTDKNETLTTKSVEDNLIENDTVVQSVGEATKETTMMPEIFDLETEESRQISMQNQNFPTTLTIDDKRKRRNFTNSDRSSELPQKTVYTIKDRIRHSKPKWDARRGFGKFSTKRTIDEDNRRKEPRYNYFKRKKKPVDDQNNYTTPRSVDGTSRITNASLLIEDEKSSTTEIYHAEESVVHQTIYRSEKEYREPGNAESTVDTKSEKSAEEKTEETTNTYKVYEDIDEDASPTTTRSTNLKNVLDLREYLESNPPGYEEAFPAENPKTETSVSSEDSSEKVEEQVETPVKTKSSEQDDDSEELISKEKEGSNKKQTFFKYARQPSSDEYDDESAERTFYPFSRYKSKPESDESRERSEETSEDYVFPWHADRGHKEGKHMWLKSFERYEYPWEKRERLARERRNKQKRANRFRKMIFSDEDDEEERRTRREKPIYAWEKYDVPSKPRVNTRRDISRDFSRRNIEEDSEEYTTENVHTEQALPHAMFTYSSSNTQPTKSSSAREISKSIRKVLEDDFNEEASKELKDSHSSVAKTSSSSSSKGISRGALVPEDITQPPRRKEKKRRKVPQPAKNVTDNSDFDSKKLENKEVSEKANEEEYFDVDYSKLRKVTLNDTETQIETTTNQPSELLNSTKEIPAASTEQRKKRRRKLFKNNSTISLDNVAAESVAELATKRRRKPQVTTTTTTTTMSTTPSASIDLAVSKSFFTPVRRRYSKTGEVVMTNELDPFKKTIIIKTAPETTTLDLGLRVKTSTPKTRTIEHRSTVSKQKIVTKTTYPSEAGFNFAKINATSAQKQEGENVKPKVRRRKKNNKQNDDKKYDTNKNVSNTENLTEQKNERENSNIEFVSEDKKVIISEKPQVEKSFEIQQEAEKKINDFNDRNINDENDNTTGDFGMMSEFQTYAIKDLLQNISPNRQRNDQANERTEGESNINEDWEKLSDEEAGEKDKDAGEKRRSLLQAKFIKNPEHRLYYYIERK